MYLSLIHFSPIALAFPSIFPSQRRLSGLSLKSAALSYGETEFTRRCYYVMWTWLNSVSFMNENNVDVFLMPPPPTHTHENLAANLAVTAALCRATFNSTPDRRPAVRLCLSSAGVINSNWVWSSLEARPTSRRRKWRMFTRCGAWPLPSPFPPQISPYLFSITFHQKFFLPLSLLFFFISFFIFLPLSLSCIESGSGWKRGKRVILRELNRRYSSPYLNLFFMS